MTIGLPLDVGLRGAVVEKDAPRSVDKDDEEEVVVVVGRREDVVHPTGRTPGGEGEGEEDVLDTERNGEHDVRSAPISSASSSSISVVVVPAVVVATWG